MSCSALASQFLTEKIAFLPQSYLTPPMLPPPASMPPPARTKLRRAYDLPSGFVFCSLNSLNKIEPTIFATWIKVLGRVPGSVLWIVGGQSSLAKKNLLAAAAASGMAGRVIMGPRLSRHALAENVSLRRQYSLIGYCGHVSVFA